MSKTGEVCCGVSPVLAIHLFLKEGKKQKVNEKKTVKPSVQLLVSIPSFFEGKKDSTTWMEDYLGLFSAGQFMKRKQNTVPQELDCLSLQLPAAE